ncbi:MAG: SagB/ThcOx family dehydrogenase [Sedimenticola sp.]
MAETLIKLPDPIQEAGISLAESLAKRRTIRNFRPQQVTLQEVAQLLWAAQGITSHDGFRTAPSAGALYPLEIHLVAGQVVGVSPGSYRYDPLRHSLTSEVSGDLRTELAQVALGQSWISEAPAVIVVSAVYSRTTFKYGRRGERYVHIEVGHAGQNLLLQATALGLASATVGAFNDAELKRLLGLPDDELPMIILPVGH